MKKKLKNSEIIIHTPAKGYVFKLRISSKAEDLDRIQKALVKQANTGIILYNDSMLELIDSYDIQLQEIELAGGIHNLKNIK